MTKSTVKNVSARSGIGYSIPPVATSPVPESVTIESLVPTPAKVTNPLPHYLTSQTSILKGGKNFATTPSSIKNVSPKPGIDYNIKSINTVSHVEISNILDEHATDESAAPPTVTPSAEYYLTSRTSIPKEGKSFAMTKSIVKNVSARSGIGNVFSAMKPVATKPDNRIEGSLSVFPASEPATSSDLLPYYLSSRTSVMKGGKDFAMTRSSVKNVSSKSGIGIKSTSTENYNILSNTPDGAVSLTDDLLLVPSPIPPFVMTNSTIKNITARSGVDYNARSASVFTDVTKSQESALVTDTWYGDGSNVDGKNYAVTNSSWKSKVAVNFNKEAIALPKEAMVDNLPPLPSEQSAISPPPSDTNSYYLSSRTSILKPGSNYAPTKTRVRNVSVNSGFGYIIGSMIIPSDTRKIQASMTETADPDSSLRRRDESPSFYLTSRTSKLKPGISFAPTKPTVKGTAALSGIGYNITSLAAAVGFGTPSTSTTVMNPYLEPLGYYLSSRTSKLKDGSSYAPTKPEVRNISGKSGTGWDLRSMMASLDLRPSSNSNMNPYRNSTESSSLPLLGEYYLTSRTSKLKDGNTFAPTKPIVKNSSGKSGLGSSIRSVLAASNIRKENVPSISTVYTTTTTSSGRMEQLEYYLPSRTSLLKPSRNDAPTSTNIKSLFGTSGIGGNTNTTDTTDTTATTTTALSSSSLSSNVFKTIQDRASTTLQQVRESLTSRTTSIFKKPGWSFAPTKSKKQL